MLQLRYYGAPYVAAATRYAYYVYSRLMPLRRFDIDDALPCAARVFARDICRYYYATPYAI